MTPKMIECPRCHEQTIAGFESETGRCEHCCKWWKLDGENAVPLLGVVERVCPSCADLIGVQLQQNEVDCGRCGTKSHLFIETKLVLRPGPLKRETDPKAASKAKAFVPQADFNDGKPVKKTC